MQTNDKLIEAIIDGLSFTKNQWDSKRKKSASFFANSTFTKLVAAAIRTRDKENCSVQDVINSLNQIYEII